MDWLFFWVLVLNATGLFRFLAPQVGVSIGYVSLILMLANVFYLVARLAHLAALVSRRDFLVFTLVLLIWPLTTLVYAQSLDMREAALLLYLFALSLGSMVYFRVNGVSGVRSVLAMSMGVSVLGLVLSMAVPAYFLGVAELAGCKSEFEGRPFGFAMEPNSLASGIVFLFVAWYPLRKSRDGVLEVIVLVLFLLVMLLTGSRTSMLLALMVASLIVLYPWRTYLKDKRRLVQIVVLVALLAGSVVGTKLYLSEISRSVSRSDYDLIDRMDALLSFKLSKEEDVKDDVSVQSRLATQSVYMSLIKERPLLGYGLGASTYFYESGATYLMAHSEALTCALEYGVLYPLAFLGVIARLCWNRNRRVVSGLLKCNSPLQFVFVTYAFYVVNGDLLDQRAFYVVLGFMFAIVLSPEHTRWPRSPAGAWERCPSVGGRCSCTENAKTTDAGTTSADAATTMEHANT